jgi:hypothetical protein
VTNTYLAGNLVRVATYAGSPGAPSGGFLNAAGDLADPAVVTLTYRPGTGRPLVTATYPAAPVIRDAAGLYHADLDTTGAAESATWTYMWSGTGAVQAAAANAFIVNLPYL